MFLEISQNSQENNCGRVSFLIKLQVCNFIKKRLCCRCFPVNFVKFLKHLFLQNASGVCFWILLDIAGYCFWIFWYYMPALFDFVSQLIFFFSCSLEEKMAFLNASHLDHGGLKAKNQLKSLFSHFYVVPQKVLWRPLTVNNATKKCGNKYLHKFLIDFFFFWKARDSKG